MHQKESLGILFVDDGTARMLAAKELEALGILASFAAVAISHARMHREVAHRAVTDGLTGLFNRRYFEELLDRELQRAERHGREFSLALVDVNDFKIFNDRYGHQAGDGALAALGSALRTSLRSSDLAARYGGDEMVIILPETRLEKAYQLFARRVERAIGEALQPLTPDRPPIAARLPQAIAALYLLAPIGALAAGSSDEVALRLLQAPFLFLVLGAAAAALVSWSWDRVRFRYDLVFEGEAERLEALNRPDRTLPQRARDFLLRLMRAARPAAQP